jgi:threonylcarbamoyladenosine tRNA methylthiotransferase MtaB
LKKVFIDSSTWCEEARLDSQRLVNLIDFYGKKNGLLNTNKPEEADLIFYYACGHLKELEDESLQALKKLLISKPPGSKLIVWGCLPIINPDALGYIDQNYLIGPESPWDFLCDKLNLSSECASNVNGNTLQKNMFQVQYRAPRLKIFNQFVNIRRKLRFGSYKRENMSENSWYIKIVSGCKNHCTYCTDLLAYKCVKSESIKKILDQFGVGLKKGYQYFFFVGRDLGSYGYDLGIDLTDLLESILSKYKNEKYRILLPNISPSSLLDMYPRLPPILSSGKIIEIGSHIQSGSNKILKLMGKNFKANEWHKVMKEIQINYPEIDLATSIMVGFPGETEQDFRQTVKLLNKMLLDRIEVYSYSERPNLPSLRIKGRLSEEIKKKRYNEINYYAILSMAKRKMQKGQFISLPLLKLLHSSYILKTDKTTTLKQEEETDYKRDHTQIYTDSPFIKADD